MPFALKFRNNADRFWVYNSNDIMRNVFEFSNLMYFLFQSAKSARARLKKALHTKTSKRHKDDFIKNYVHSPRSPMLGHLSVIS